MQMAQLPHGRNVCDAGIWNVCDSSINGRYIADRVICRNLVKWAVYTIILPHSPWARMCHTKDFKGTSIIRTSVKETLSIKDTKFGSISV